MKFRITLDEYDVTFYKDNEADYFLKGIRGILRQPTNWKFLWNGKSLWEWMGYKWELLDKAGNQIARFKQFYNWKTFPITFELIFLPERTEGSHIYIVQFKHSPPYYELHTSAGCYQLIQHRELFRSVFKNGQQIGVYQQESAHISMTKTAKFWLDDDADIELACTLVYCAILNTETDSEPFTIDIGHIGKELKKLDRSWKVNSN